jgi:hypothetical protein
VRVNRLVRGVRDEGRSEAVKRIQVLEYLRPTVRKAEIPEEPLILFANHYQKKTGAAA